jgi:hypothetical protein
MRPRLVYSKPEELGLGITEPGFGRAKGDLVLLTYSEKHGKVFKELL